jgi:hypothetical protein
VLLVDRASGRLAVNLGRAGDTALTTLDWTDAESREIQRVDAEALRLLYVALTRAERSLVLPVPARPEGRGFYQYLGVLLDAPTDILTTEELEPSERPPAVPARAPLPEETLETWRARRRALVARVGAGEERAPGDGAIPGPARSRAARRRAAAAELARAALLVVDLGRPDDGPSVIRVLGARRGARPEVVVEATRLLAEALAAPVIGRARRAAWLARDVPVAVEAAGAVTEDRLDLVFEEPAGLIVVRVGAAADDVAPGLPAAALAPALGRPVREVLTLSLINA